MKKIIAFILLLLFGSVLLAKDSTTVTSYGENAILLIKKGDALKSMDYEISNKQLQQMTETATFIKDIAGNTESVAMSFKEFNANAPPRAVILNISQKTGIPVKEIEEIIDKKLIIDSVFNVCIIIVAILWLICMITFFKQDWRFYIVSMGTIVIILWLLSQLSEATNSLINYDYDRIYEILRLSG